jgi:membrane-associated protease RseP (regulator of RpoE activity)
MKKWWSLKAVALVCGCQAVGGVCRGQETVETQTQTQVQVQVVGQGDGDGSKKSEVRVVQVQSTKPEEVVARIEQMLKDSGLDDEARKKVVEQVKQLAAKAPGGQPMVMAVQSRKGEGAAKEGRAPEVQVQVQAVPQVPQQNEAVESQQMVFVDEDGKQHTVQVIRKGAPQIQGGRVQVQMIPPARGGNAPAAVPQVIPPLPPMAPGNVQAIPLNVPMMVQGFPLQAQVQLGQAIQVGNRFALGVSLEPPAEDESAPGLVIKEVMENSAASEAGLEPGDRIVVIDGEEVESVEQVVDLVQKAGAEGKSMDLVIQRGEGGEEEKQIEVKPRASALPQGIEQLENMLQQIPGGLGGGGGFFVPQPEAGFGWNAGGEAMEEVKKELKSIREDLQEIKEMLAEIKAMEEDDEEDDDD